MNFEQRKSEAERLVADFLDDFVPPRGLDNEKLRARIAFIGDAFARKMPTKGDYAEAVNSVMLKIRDTHMSNTWPSQAVFVMAMPAGEVKEFAQLQEFKPDKKEMYERRMADGLGVPEGVIWGATASQLSVSRDVLDSYRKASAASWQNLHKQEAHRLMRDKYGPAVDQFFRSQVAS